MLPGHLHPVRWTEWHPREPRGVQLLGGLSHSRLSPGGFNLTLITAVFTKGTPGTWQAFVCFISFKTMTALEVQAFISPFSDEEIENWRTQIICPRSSRGARFYVQICFKFPETSTEITVSEVLVLMLKAFVLHIVLVTWFSHCITERKEKGHDGKLLEGTQY